MKPQFFKTRNGKLKTPIFFPDATRAVLKTLDSQDIESTRTPGLLVNTYHLYLELGKRVLKTHQGIGNFMSWKGGLISDSGGFQIMSLVKSTGNGKITDQGVTFHSSKKKKVLLTPEKSIDFQMHLKTDMVVVLDDFTTPNTDKKTARDTVARTILWAERSKSQFEKICKRQKLGPQNRPYLLAVVQGGEFLDLRKKCTQKLAAIGFDGLGYGGWPLTAAGKFNYRVAEVIAENTPPGYFLYGLGIGKPDEIVNCVKLGYHIFDCVLPTRDARHKRLYVYNAESIKKIDPSQPDFYSYYTPDKEKYYQDPRPVSSACDCLLCRRYTRAYLAHLFRSQEMTAGRLATIHNLRFYSLLMDHLKKQ